MQPDMKIEVTPNDDTVEVKYIVHTTDATITGTVTDEAGVDLEEDFGINASVDIAGNWNWEKGVWYHSNAKISPDGSFSIPVSSLYPRYQIHTWADNLPPGYFVIPQYIDSVGPGQTGVAIAIKKANQFVNLSVTDENNTPVKKLPVELWEKNSNFEVKGETDANGKAFIAVAPGSWEIWVDDNTYMAQHYIVEVSETDDTINVIYSVHTTDAVISGTISGEISNINLSKDIAVFACTNDTVSKIFISEAEINSTGAFIINVSSKFAGYLVQMDNWNLPEHYVICPTNLGPNYVYLNVAPGTGNIAFQILAPKGSISGSFTMNMPDPSKIEYVGVVAVDSIPGQLPKAVALSNLLLIPLIVKLNPDIS